MTTNNSWNADYNDTKGSLLVGNATRPTKLAVGADTFVLTADSAQATGVKWAAGGAGSGVSLSPYIVGPTNSDFTVIQDAIDQAVADGASATNPYNIYIKPTPSGYTENLTLSLGVNLIGFNNVTSRNDSSSSMVFINGNVSVPGGSFLIKNISIQSVTAAQNVIEFTSTSATLYLDNVNLSKSSSGTVFSNTTFTGTSILYCTNCTFTSSSTALFSIDSSSSFQIYFFDVNVVADTDDSSFTGTGNIQFFCRESTVQLHIVTDDLVGAAFVDNSRWTTSTAEYLLDVGVAQGEFTGKQSYFSFGTTPLLSSSSGTQSLMGCEFYALSGGIPAYQFNGFSHVRQSESNIGEIFRNIITNDFHGTYSDRSQAVVQTVGAGATTIATIPVLDNEMIGIVCRYDAFRSDFAAAQSGNLAVTARAAAGTATIAGTPTLFPLVPPGDAALVTASISAVASGANVLIQVTGIAATTINWSCDYEVLHTQSAT